MTNKYTVYLGENLSGELIPSIVKEGEVLLGVKSCGLLGFVEFLEQHLGLRAPRASEAILLESYLQAIHKVKSGAFFEASLRSDALALAKDLFEKRTELLEAGYTLQECGVPRLNDLYKVEKEFEVRDSLPDRTIKLVDFLKAETQHPLGKVILLRPRADFAPLYEKLFQQLEKTGVVFQEMEQPIWAPKIYGIKVKNHHEAAKVMKALLQTKPEAVLYIQQGMETLDLLSQTDGLPSLGAEVNSVTRPVLQLVHLLSEFLWEPLDPRRVMEFLNLPVKPLSGKLARKLAHALGESPGFGGDPWAEATEEYFAEETDEDQKEKNKERLAFLFERKRFPHTGAPLKEVCELFRYLAHYLRAREFSMESEAVTSIIDLLNLTAWRQASVTKLELEKILENSVQGLNFCQREKEVGSRTTFSSGENLVGTVQDLIWYPFTDVYVKGRLLFWDQTEVEFLKKSGVTLLKSFEKTRMAMNLERKLNASVEKAIYLIIPQMLRDEETSEHPLIHELKPEFLDVKTLLADSMERVPVKYLPKIKGEWKLKNTHLITPRKEESYSSLETLFYTPWIYLLEKHAKLDTGSVLTVADDEMGRTRGTFSHKVFEEFFMTHPTPESMKGKASEEWFEKNFPRILDQYGILWKLPGFEKALTQLTQEISHSLKTLARHLSENNWTVEEPEKKINGEVFKTPLLGYIDMALRRGDERCVLDLKYRGKKKYKKKLEENEDLQLALYSKLYGKGNFAYTAYFIISSAQLFSKELNAFKETNNKPASDHQKIYAELLDQMGETYATRMEEIKKGEIVVRDVLTKGLFKETNVQGEEHLNVDGQEGNSYHDFDVLLGFKR